MIYEQILPSKGTRRGKLKRAFQFVGFLHFLLGFVFSILLVFIYWKLALLPFCFMLFGFAWGSTAYLFVSDYKYIYKDGKFFVYRQNSYGKYRLKLECFAKDIEYVQEKQEESLTNIKESLQIKVFGKVYSISPDDYMLSLIKKV